MEYDFHYLIYRYTLPGAREKFEDICTRLLQKLHGNDAHRIAVSRGDGGIDVMLRDMSEPFHIFQCKYFPNGIGPSQQKQIEESFQKASAHKIERWTLCLGFDLTKEAMAWWSKWKKDAQAQTNITIDLYDGTYLLNQLRDQGLYEEVFESAGARELREVLESCKALLSSGLLCAGTTGHEAAEILSPELIAEAQCACTAKDLRKYYTVDNGFRTMLRVMSSGNGIPNPEAEDAVFQALNDDRPVILAGNGGMGKTSLMLCCAIRWVRSGDPAVWLSLSDRRDMTAQEAKVLCRALQSSVGEGQKLLICIDDPFEGQEALDHLRRAISGTENIRLLLAERSNRLSILADRNKNRFSRWFDDALVLVLEGEAVEHPFRLNSYEVISFRETSVRRKAVLGRCLSCLEAEQIIPAGSAARLLEQAMKLYARSNVSLVELIYRTLFLAQEGADKPEEIRLDWDEWTWFLHKKLSLTDEARWLYGPIAACSVFGIPMSVPLFCHIFDRRPSELHRAMRDWKIKGHAEPIRYLERGDQLRPKHAVAAELFFLFHAEREGNRYRTGEVITDAMLDIVEAMDEQEISGLLHLLVVNKNMLKNGKWGHFTGIDHWGILDRILLRHEDRDIRLEDEPLATALLGLLWAIPAGKNAAEKRDTLAYLSRFAPQMFDDLTMAKLYTEWGKLLAEERKYEAAEEKLKAVISCNKKDIHSRTELGRLLAKQPGREKDAERFLLEAMHIDPNHIQSRTELGRLLAKQPGREKDAERFLLEILSFDPRNIQARTELGRLHAKQPGRENDAERFLMEAIRIDPKNLHPHTELGRLLAKQPGREKDAERFLLEAIQIDPKNLHPHTELGRLLAKQPGREKDAERFLMEAMHIDPKHIQSRTELGRLLAKQPGREKDAERFLLEAMHIDPKHIQSRTELGRLLAKQPGREKDAERFLLEILSFDPSNIQARTELGRLLVKQPGRETEAEHFLREILAIDKRNLHARTVLADLCIRQNRLSEAEQLYRAVQKLDPKNRYAINGLNKLGKRP